MNKQRFANVANLRNILLQKERTTIVLKLFAALVIAVAAMGVLIILSVRADRRLQDRERLPMQWSLSGEPTWSAPRRIALAFTPTLSAIILCAAVISVVTLEPHPGQEGLEIPVIAFMSASMIGAHLFHLWLIQRRSSNE